MEIGDGLVEECRDALVLGQGFGVAVMGTGFQTAVAAEEAFLGEGEEFVGDFAAVFYGQVGEAAAGIQLVRGI